MNLFKKIDQFLLLNHPTIWHSKILFLLPLSILLNVIFFFWGYLYTNDELLSVRSFIEYYGSSFALLFHILILLVIYIFWLIAFIKKNAFQRLYPLKKHHFTKLLVLFFVGFIGLITPSFSFYKGAQKKVIALHPWETLTTEIKQANLASAFLPNSSENYDFPDYFVWKLSVTTHEDFDYFRGTDTLKNENDWMGYSWRNKFYSPHEHPENNILVDGTSFQFYTEKPKNCEENYHERTVILKFIVDNVDSAHHLYDFRNFHNNTYAYSNHFYLDFLGIREDYLPNRQKELNNASFTSNRTLYLSLIRNKNKSKIIKVLEDYKGVLTKYKIPHVLEPHQVAQMLIEKDFKGVAFRCHSDYYSEYAFKRPITLEAFYENELYHLSWSDDNKLDRIFKNSYDAYFINYGGLYYRITLTITLVLSLLMLLVYFASRRGFIFSIAFLIALFIINLIVFISFYSWYHQQYLETSFIKNYEEKFIMSQLLANWILILFLVIWSIHKNWSKILQEVLIVSGYVIVGFIPIIIIFFLDAFTYTILLDKCGVYSNRYSFFFENLFYFGIITPACIACILLYSRLFKKYLANPSRS